MTVNFEDKKVLIEKVLIDCKRGQSILSIDSWSKLFGKGWSPQKTRTFFSKLKTDSMINIEGLQYSTRLTVCNYETYQSDQRTNNEPITNQQQTDNELITTTKEVKEYKNEKEIILPLPEKPEKVKKLFEYPSDFENFWKEYLSKTKRSIGSKPNAMAQWKKLSEIERKLSLERLSSYQSSMSMGEFMKDAERYLKGKIWESYDLTVQLEIGIPVNNKTGNPNGRDLPPKKTWEEFLQFCEMNPYPWMKDLNKRKAYIEVPFDRWGKVYLIDFLKNFISKEGV
jgi:hypothetical protein